MRTSEHDRALAQHQRRYDDMIAMRDEHGRDSDEYRRARADVIEAHRLIRPAR